MITRAKPKQFEGVDPLSVAAEIDRVLSDDDYRMIIKTVPLKRKAEKAMLKADIRIAATWYVIEGRMREAPKANEIKAALTTLADQLERALRTLESLDFESRRRLWGQVEAPPPAIDDHGEPIAWRSPIASEQASVRRLRQLARAAAKTIRPRRGAKLHVQSGLKVLLTAWRQATGLSAFTEGKNGGEFLEFVSTLVRLLGRKGFRVAAPSRRQMVRAYNLLR